MPAPCNSPSLVLAYTCRCLLHLACSWVYELGRVQVMINQAHCKGLGMSRDQACFGVRPYTQLKPNAARMAEMLGWNR